MILRQMHLAIIEDLKRNEDKAEVGIQMMDKMTSEYQKMSEELEKKAGNAEGEVSGLRFVKSIIS